MAAAAFDGLTLWYPETGAWFVVDGTVETDYGSNPLALPHRPMTTIPILVPVGTRTWTIPANTTVVLRIRSTRTADAAGRQSATDGGPAGAAGAAGAEERVIRVPIDDYRGQ